MRAPYAWIVSLVCQEFACTPSVALAELEADAARDEPLMFDILDLRRLVEAKTDLDRAMNSGQPLAHPSAMHGEVAALLEQLHRERLSAR